MTATLADGPRARARLALLAEATALAVVLALRTWVTRGRFIYDVTGDEASQLAIARTLSGARPFHLTGYPFDAGFGAVVAPIYVFVEDPELAFRLVLVANVALAGVTFLVLRALVVRVTGASGPAAAWGAAVALVLPGASLQTAYTGAEVLITLLVATAALLVVMLRGRHGTWAAYGLAVTGGVMVLTHSRLAGVVGALLVVLVASALRREISRSDGVLASVLMVGLSWGALVVNEWVYELVWLQDALDLDQFGEILDKLRQPLAIVASAAGMAWTQAVTTFGLVVVGLGHLVVTSVRRGDGRWRVGVREWQRWKLLLVLAAAALPAAVYMSGRDRAWFMVYGRYWDPLAVPLVAVGVGWLLRVDVRRAGRALAASLLVVAGGGLAFAWVRQDRLLQLFDQWGFGNPRRIAALLTFIPVGSPIDALLITTAAAAVLGVVVAVVVLVRRGHRVVLAVVLTGVAVTATARGSIHLNEYSAGLDRWRPAADLVEDGVVPEDEVVAFRFDEEVYDELDPRFPYAAYQFYEPGAEFLRTDDDEVLDYDYAVSSVTDDLLEDQGWRVVFEHPDGLDVAVWRSP